jgi:hypothetical protein
MIHARSLLRRLIHEQVTPLSGRQPQLEELNVRDAYHAWAPAYGEISASNWWRRRSSGSHPIDFSRFRDADIAVTII